VTSYCAIYHSILPPCHPSKVVSNSEEICLITSTFIRNPGLETLFQAFGPVTAMSDDHTSSDCVEAQRVIMTPVCESTQRQTDGGEGWTYGLTNYLYQYARCILEQMHMRDNNGDYISEACRTSLFVIAHLFSNAETALITIQCSVLYSSV